MATSASASINSCWIFLHLREIENNRKTEKKSEILSMWWKQMMILMHEQVNRSNYRPNGDIYKVAMKMTVDAIKRLKGNKLMSSNYLFRDSFVTFDTVPTQQLHSPSSNRRQWKLEHIIIMSGENLIRTWQNTIKLIRQFSHWQRKKLSFVNIWVIFEFH